MITWLCIAFGLLAAAGMCCCFVPCYYFSDSPSDPVVTEKWETIAGSWLYDPGSAFVASAIYTYDEDAIILCNTTSPDTRNAIEAAFYYPTTPSGVFSQEIRIITTWQDSENYSFVKFRQYRESIGGDLLSASSFVYLEGGVSHENTKYLLSLFPLTNIPPSGFPRFAICYNDNEICVSGNSGGLPILHRFKNTSPPFPYRWGFATGASTLSSGVAKAIISGVVIYNTDDPNSSALYGMITAHVPHVESASVDCNECDFCNDFFGEGEEMPETVELDINSTSFPEDNRSPDIFASPRRTCWRLCNMGALSGTYVLTRIETTEIDYYYTNPGFGGPCYRTSQLPACAYLLEDAAVIECDETPDETRRCYNDEVSIDLLVVINTRTDIRVHIILKQHGTLPGSPDGRCANHATYLPSAGVVIGVPVVFDYSSTNSQNYCGFTGTVHTSNSWCEGPAGQTNQVSVTF